MKRQFKTKKPLTAVKETDHTKTTAEGRIIHRKLACNPLKFQPSEKSDEPRKPTSRCCRCGRKILGLTSTYHGGERPSGKHK